MPIKRMAPGRNVENISYEVKLLRCFSMTICLFGNVFFLSQKFLGECYEPLRFDLGQFDTALVHSLEYVPVLASG